MVLHGDATDQALLEEENLEEMDAFIAATGLDEENLLLALIAKQVKVEDVISKVSSESYKDLIEQMGIDMVLNRWISSPVQFCATFKALSASFPLC